VGQLFLQKHTSNKEWTIMDTNQNDSANLPVRHNLTLVFVISFVIAVLMAAASIVGLVDPTTTYPTDELRQSFLPNDVVNLVIGLPALLGSLWLARRGKLIGLLFWPGALFYVFYAYLVYILSMPLNWPFLAHLMLVVLSGYALVGLLASINAKTVKLILNGAVAERAGGGVLAVLGILFFMRASFIMANAVLGHTALIPTELALNTADFLITPAWVIGGVLLWRRQAFGYVCGLGLLFQSSMLFIGLIFIMILQPFMTAAPFVFIDVLVIFVMGMVCFIPLALFMRGTASKRGLPSL
jgi:hypothetical protein